MTNIKYITWRHRPITSEPNADISNAELIPTLSGPQLVFLHLLLPLCLVLQPLGLPTMIPRATVGSTASVAHLSSRSLRSQAVRSFATVQEGGASPVQHHGGLKDQDRIFTNLYGHHGSDIKSAMKFGDWYRTKDIILKGDNWVGNIH